MANPLRSNAYYFIRNEKPTDVTVSILFIYRRISTRFGPTGPSSGEFVPLFTQPLVPGGTINKRNLHVLLNQMAALVLYSFFLMFFYSYIMLACLTLTNFNPLKPELIPICYLLASLGAHHFLHVSRIRVKLLTLR